MPQATLEDTGEMPVTRDVMRRAFRLNEVFTLLVACATAIGGVFGAYKLLLSEARAEADAGVLPVAQKADATQRELERFQGEMNRRLTRVEESANRQEQKLDRLLDRFQVPNPAPAPKDGGR